MSATCLIPIFPLNILPLPEELVSLHIFEPRYRELLSDLESGKINSFGILFASQKNERRVGALVSLNEIVKRYETGESDIVVQCHGTFLLQKYFKSYKDRLYSGGEVNILNTPKPLPVSEELLVNFETFQKYSKNKFLKTPLTLNHIASVIKLEHLDRIKFLCMPNEEKKARFLLNRLEFSIHLLKQEQKTGDAFILN